MVVIHGQEYKGRKAKKMEITFSLVGILTSVLNTTIEYPLMGQIEMLCLTDVVKQ